MVVSFSLGNLPLQGFLRYLFVHTSSRTKSLHVVMLRTKFSYRPVGRHELRFAECLIIYGLSVSIDEVFPFSELCEFNCLNFLHTYRDYNGMYFSSSSSSRAALAASSSRMNEESSERNEESSRRESSESSSRVRQI